MYSIESKDESMTRLSWDSSRKVYIYGNGNGEAVSADLINNRTTFGGEGGNISCLAMNTRGNHCAYAVEDSLLECEYPSLEKLDSSHVNGTSKALSFTHLQYDSDGTHL